MVVLCRYAGSLLSNNVSELDLTCNTGKNLLTKSSNDQTVSDLKYPSIRLSSFQPGICGAVAAPDDGARVDN